MGNTVELRAGKTLGDFELVINGQEMRGVVSCVPAVTREATVASVALLVDALKMNADLDALILTGPEGVELVEEDIRDGN